MLYQKRFDSNSVLYLSPYCCAAERAKCLRWMRMSVEIAQQIRMCRAISNISHTIWLQPDRCRCLPATARSCPCGISPPQRHPFSLPAPLFVSLPLKKRYIHAVRFLVLDAMHECVQIMMLDDGGGTLFITF